MLARRTLLAGLRRLSFQPATIARGFAKRPEDFFQDSSKAGQESKAQTFNTAGQTTNPKGEQDPLLNNPLEDENSFYNEKKSSFYIFMGAGVSLLGLYFIMMINSATKEKKAEKNTVTHMGRANIGGPWRLIDMQGKPFGSGDLDGKYYFIYFGFCRCPDVCPQSLYKLTKALELIRKSPEKKYFDLETIFVTVDPDRDTPEDIKKFLSNFDPKIIPVTGKNNNDPNLKQMMAKFKIHASKIEMEDDRADPSLPKPYTLDHTIITYLMDDENKYVAHLGSNMSASEIAQHVLTKVNLNQREKLVR